MWLFCLQTLYCIALSGNKAHGNSPSKSALRRPDTPTKPHPPIKAVSWASDSFEEGELTDSQLRKRLEECSTDNLAYVIVSGLVLQYYILATIAGAIIFAIGMFKYLYIQMDKIMCRV